MSLRNDLQDKHKFIITAELNPPKSTDASKVLENALKIKDSVSAVNITDMSGANMKMCSLAVSALLEQNGIETIWQMTCRDRNRLALQSDLLGGIALGIKNILPLKGDDPKTGDHSETGQCFDLGTEDLLKALQNLKTGKDFNNNDVKIETLPFDYCVGSAAHPGVPNLAQQKETMQRRLGLGVEFFQTQISFDKKQIDQFVEAIGDELASKTIIGITPIKTLGQAVFMNDNIFGVTVPDDCLRKMETAFGTGNEEADLSKERQQFAGLEIAKDLVDHIRKTPLKGIHLMAIGQESKLDQIIEHLNTGASVK